MHSRHALDEMVPNDGRYAAPVAGKSMYELCFRRVGGDVGDALDAAGE